LLLFGVFNGLRHKHALRYGDADVWRVTEQQATHVQRLHAQRHIFGRLDDVAEESEEIGFGDEHGGVCGAAGTSAETLDVGKRLIVKGF
jgi:hypothetical protein